MSITEPLPSYLFDVDYPAILDRVERRVRGRIRAGIHAMFYDFGHDSEIGDLIADLRSGDISPATLYHSFDVLVTRAHLMDEPIRQALDDAGLSVMRIVGRDAGAAVDRWALRSTTSAAATDVRFDPADPSLLTELRMTGDLYWQSLTSETARAFRDEIERSYYANDGAAQMADRLEIMAGLTPQQAESLDRLRTTMKKGPLSPLAQDVALRQNADRMRDVRAESIMRTELHRITNAGATAYWRQMGRKGALDYNTAYTKWNTHRDEKTCPSCGPLDGVMVVMGGQFAPGVLTPPMHPNCRCTLSLQFQINPDLIRTDDGIMKALTDGDGDGFAAAFPGGPDIIPVVRKPPTKKTTPKVKHDSIRHDPPVAHGLSQAEIGAAMGDTWGRSEWLDADGKVMADHPGWRIQPGETKVEYRIRSKPGEIPVRQIVRHTNTPKGEQQHVWPGEQMGLGDYVETVGPIPYVYRVVSENDYQRMKKQGFLDTDGRGNIGTDEGLVTDSDIAWTYLGDIGGFKGTDNPTGKGRVIRIKVRPEDGWKADHDGYVKTQKPVPFDQVDMISQAIGIKRLIHGDPEGSHSIHTEWDYSDAPMHVTVPDDPSKYGVQYSDVKQPNGAPVRGTPIDPKTLPETLYHVTLNRHPVGDAGRLRAGGVGGLGGDDRDMIVSLTATKEMAVKIRDAMKVLSNAAVGSPDESDVFEHDPEVGRKMVAAFQAAAEEEGWTWNSEVHDFQLTDYTFRDWANQFMWQRESQGGHKNPLFFGVTREHWAKVNPYNMGIVEVSRDDIVRTGAMVTDFDYGRGGGLDEFRVYGDVQIKRDRITKRRELRLALTGK